MLIQRLVVVLIATAVVWSPVHAQDWLSLTTDRFTVVSRLSERDTERWAREFNRFVNALGGLIPANERLLPELTVVLFRRAGGFAPYRIRTESGVATGNTGVFLNAPSWSLIAMPGVRGSSTDNSTVYHEAVHWYMSADPSDYPLWFVEGIAEVFSTFDIEGSRAQWGRPIDQNLEFLNGFGLQPMEEFLQVTQDQALHTNITYYSQAWLFVHYLLFSQLEDRVELLSPLLLNLRTMSNEEAFQATFGRSIEDMDRVLRNYARETRLNAATSTIGDAAQLPDVTTADAELVETSLARLAYGTGNDEQMREHMERLQQSSPESAAYYDLLAEVRLRAGDDDIEDLLDQAIALGSRDARTYELKAALMSDDIRQSSPLFSDRAFDAADARRIANYLVSSTSLRPLNLRAYSALADALFSVDQTEEYDRVAFENGALLYPTEGIMQIGLAALALHSGDSETAFQLISAAQQSPYRLTISQRAGAQALEQRLARQQPD